MWIMAFDWSNWRNASTYADLKIGAKRMFGLLSQRLSVSKTRLFSQLLLPEYCLLLEDLCNAACRPRMVLPSRYISMLRKHS
jgi:hypothetical protein